MASEKLNIYSLSAPYLRILKMITNDTILWSTKKKIICCDADKNDFIYREAEQK